MAKQNDLSRCLVTLEQDATVIAVIEMGQSSLAGRRYCAWTRTQSFEEAQPRPGCASADSASLAEGSGAGWTRDQTDCRRL